MLFRTRKINLFVPKNGHSEDVSMLLNCILCFDPKETFYSKKKKKKKKKEKKKKKKKTANV